MYQNYSFNKPPLMKNAATGTNLHFGLFEIQEVN